MITITIPYKDREKASITVARIDEPYGEKSGSVLSIGATLKGDIDNPTWKVHIPVDLVEEVIAAMKEASDPERRNHVD